MYIKIVSQITFTSLLLHSDKNLDITSLNACFHNEYSCTLKLDTISYITLHNQVKRRPTFQYNIQFNTTHNL